MNTLYKIILKAAFFLVFAIVVMATPSFAQTEISGTITDQFTREALSGARILVKGTKIGTVANSSGKFTLKTASTLAPEDVVTISILGYKTKNIPVSEIISQISSGIQVELAPQVITSQQVAVTANRQSQLRSEMPVAVSVVSKQLIEETKPAMIYEVMNKVPGVVMTNLGNEQHSMAIRSPLTTRALFLYLEDGIPIRTTGVFNHNALMEINLPAIRGIDVIKGPGSAMYGANAVSGAVNFLTQRAGVRPVLEFGVQGDNFGYQRGNVNLANTFGEGVGSLGVYAGGYYAQQKTSWRDFNSMEKLSASIRADYRLAERTALELTYSVNNLRSDMPGGIDSLMYFSQRYPSNNTIAYRDNKAQRGRLTLDHTFENNANIRASVFYRNNQLLMLPSFRLRNDPRNPRGAFGELSDSRFTSLGADVQFRTSLMLGEIQTNLVAGLFYENSPHTVRAKFLRIGRETVNGSTIYNSVTQTDSTLTSYDVGLQNIAGYAQAEFVLTGQWKAIAGVRYDRLAFDFKNNLPPSAFTGAPDQTTSYNNIAPRFGVMYNADAGTGMYANYSIGFLPPELSELFRGVSVPNLSQASFNNYEVGGYASFLDGRAYLDMSLYLLDGINEVISVQIEQNVFQNRNAGATRHYGVEFQVGFVPVDEVNIRIGGTYARHIFMQYRERVGAAERIFDNNDMPQAPDLTTFSEITYKPSWLQGFRIGAELQTMGQYFQDVQNTRKYAGHAVVNLRAGYKTGGLDVFVNVLNVANTLYAETSSWSSFGYSFTPANPRLFSVGASYNLGALFK
ncbi:MAG: TonB-dependent receptor [Candidatus Kapaibacteriota bacterium]